LRDGAAGIDAARLDDQAAGLRLLAVRLRRAAEDAERVLDPATDLDDRQTWDCAYQRSCSGVIAGWRAAVRASAGQMRTLATAFEWAADDREQTAADQRRPAGTPSV
jgi:hypothetical protein